MDDRYKIVYSKKIMLGLVEQGIFPIKSMPNPDYRKYNCWIFKNNAQFQNEFKRLKSIISSDKEE